MLNRIGNQLNMACEMPRQIPSEDRYARNEMEDMCKAMQYLYEFRDKLAKLHPNCIDIITHLMQNPRY